MITQYKLAKSIHRLFEEQAKRSPNKISLIYNNQALSYRELNTRANQLASHLQAQGVKPEQLIGIYIERSLEVIVSILGILKAGCAYVPLDPQYPKERLSAILKDTKLSIIVTKTSLKQELPLNQASVICIDCIDIDSEIISENPDIFISDDKPHNLAYIMYTSGSTGKPKGVEMPHVSISNYVQALNQILQINSEDIYLHTASFSFSSSLRQLMLPLTQGAKIVLATQEQIKNPLSLIELIKYQEVTVFDTVQSVWRYLLKALEELNDVTREQLLENQLRLLLFSGGLLPNELFQKVRSIVKGKACIVNIYGQTETIGVCAYPIPQHFDQELVYLPIGRPYSYVELYLLNENCQPVSVGEIGEIHIAGAGLARGYFNCPELTQERFIPHPFSQEPGERLYKTGDLGRYLPDGNLECVGRADYQVKIRGIRIELGEIESSILRHPAVQEVVVVTRKIDISGELSLVAYLVFQPGQTLSNKELRNFLRDKLPDYMMPATFVTLEALPLTPNGKIDRAALPVYNSAQQAAQNKYIAPRNQLEIQLTKIWEKIFGIQPIGIRDNFFELGGHSLLAVSLFQEIEQTWGTKIPLATLFQTQTIEEFAELLRQDEFSAQGSSLVPIQPGKSTLPLFCIHPIGGNVLEYHDLAHYIGQERPIYGLQSRGLDGRQEPLSRVEDMAFHYIQEIRNVQPNGPYFLLGYSFGGLVAFEMAQQLSAQGEKIALLALIDTIPATLKLVRPPFTETIKLHVTNLWKLPLKQKWRYIQDRIDHYFNNLTYKDMLLRDLSSNETVATQYLDIIDNNLQASNNYLPKIYPGAVNLFRCSVQRLETAHYPDLGWGDLVAGKLEIYDIPSSHYTALKQPDVKVLADQLSLCLKKAEHSPD